MTPPEVDKDAEKPDHSYIADVQWYSRLENRMAVS